MKLHPPRLALWIGSASPFISVSTESFHEDVTLSHGGSVDQTCPTPVGTISFSGLTLCVFVQFSSVSWTNCHSCIYLFTHRIFVLLLLLKLGCPIIIIFDNEVFPVDFVVHRNNRPTRGGGVLLAVHHSILSIVLFSPPSSLELLAVKVFIPYPVCCLYVPPSPTSVHYSNLFIILDN